MDEHDWKRPFTSVEKMGIFSAVDTETAHLYGAEVRAFAISNVDYKIRFGKLKATQVMKSPPSCGRIFPGYLVVRKIGTTQQYETWMPEYVFEELYEQINRV